MIPVLTRADVEPLMDWLDLIEALVEGASPSACADQGRIAQPRRRQIAVAGRVDRRAGRRRQIGDNLRGKCPSRPALGARRYAGFQ